MLSVFIRRGLRIVGSNRTAPLAGNLSGRGCGTRRANRKATDMSGSTKTFRLAVAATIAVVGLATACVPPTTPTPTYTEGVCPTEDGVTVVVDFTTDLSGEIVVRCALGAQATGLDALGAIGLSVNENAPDAFPGSVCTLDGLPAEGYPYCWSTGGFWGYWAAADQDASWGFSPIGAGSGPLTEGSVIGFAWAQDFSGDEPRVAPDGTPSA